MTQTSKAERVAALLSVDPSGLGGVWLRARHGPSREAILSALREFPGRHERAFPEVGDDALFGGLDLSQSLISGKLVNCQGLLARADVLWISRAERMQTRLAARLAHAVDRRAVALILEDEGAGADERPPEALTSRLAFFLSDEDMPCAHSRPSPREIGAARSKLETIRMSDALVASAVKTTSELGSDDMRPALLLVNAARAIAALDDAEIVTEEHLVEAASLVLAHRVRACDATEKQETQSEVAEAQGDGRNDDKHPSLEDILLEAVRVPLPNDLLAVLAHRKQSGQGSGAGADRVSYQRGRPLPSRTGMPDGRARLDVLSTLMAAAPWQRLRLGIDGRLAIRKSDLRIRRHQERSERMLIFVVDASGSAAMARLAEAKGAAEALLSEAYRSRDHVSLITFRGDTAECALEPTRSLVRAKRLLGGLPGGGTTPLAAALARATEQVTKAQKKGLTPHVILMTDGRANKTLDGRTDRAEAREDACSMARHMAHFGVPVLVVDSGLRPAAELDEIARILDARKIRLPRGQAGVGSKTLLDALGG